MLVKRIALGLFIAGILQLAGIGPAISNVYVQLAEELGMYL